MALTCLERLLLLTLLLPLVTHSQPQETIDDPSHSHHIPTQTDVQNKEHSLEEQFKKQIEQQLNQWVVDQIHANTEHSEVQPYETIFFYLEPNVTHLYRVPVSLQQTMNIAVTLFHVDPQGVITLPENPQQNQYVQMMSSHKSSHNQVHQGNTYISKIFNIHFHENHKVLKFRNNKNQPVIVMVDLEQSEMVMKLAVSDDKFELTNKKIQALLKEAKETEVNREHLYKWQWGFYQKHQRHQVDMLGFTGAQLFAIIGTSIVQMYCIKSLIDNELVI